MPEQQQQQVKRRRVTRACDECRKKKVKCDGQQPCIHCTVYSYECTYNQPSKRTNSSVTGSMSATNISSQNMLSTLNIQSGSAASSAGTRKYNTKSSKLQHQIDRYRQLFNEMLPGMPSDINTVDIPTFIQILRNFKGNSNSFLDDVVKEYRLIVDNESEQTASLQSPTYSSPDPLHRSTSTASVNGIALERSVTPQSIGREIKIILPPKPIALQFVYNTWHSCFVLLRIYHRPSFLKQLDELYETDPHNYTVEQMKFLPLCYSTMAVGALFSKSTISKNNYTKGQDDKNKFLQDEGYKYFIAARKLIDITNTRDLNSIQTVLMLFIFLQCSARLSSCYTYIGVAMRSVLREGYHRASDPNDPNINPIELEMKKRLFYNVYKMDIYINAMLGLPRSLRVEDFDQTLPIELSDENITAEGYFYERQKGELSSIAISNQHTKLIMVFDTIVSELYPLKKTNNMISHETVTRLEAKLTEWVDNLPVELRPTTDAIPPKYERANKLLQLSFLHVQIILYRPFIHYLSRNFTSTVKPDKLSLERARNSLTVARTVIRMAQELINKNLISGSYWYANYTIFYSVAGLLFYIHEAELPDRESAKEYYEILKDAEQGRNILMQLKDTSMAANRTYNILNKLFEKLNARTIQLSMTHKSPYEAQASILSSNLNAENNNMESLVNMSPQTNSTNGAADIDTNYNFDNFIKNLNSSSPSQASVAPVMSNLSIENIASNDGNGRLSSLENDDEESSTSKSIPIESMFIKQNSRDDNINDRKIYGLDQASNLPYDAFKNNGENDNTGAIKNVEALSKEDREKFALLNSNSDILNVFDELDTQLFGKYVRNPLPLPDDTSPAN
ncbi:hypothetical protein KAFR_0J01710 [Kazachstania africana CBS 2517]|uniref:Zn(2)-C6 fungal-type domain-containing protein n=1 Tax=Kazachstania africana (strain ATCC 22294 / BCRC 22015 / CBS 2517 / CECT 1963 / NBRC 1671 / NRRL Y-8276) TaxID=1071382 RepID=H2B0T5_KAZAF|nr:hypothetical protein KAFR_0J01710 [Kazachstania africana CBS 2517]CCF60235.1 hypothetical protein KAFR_0J01710 [Kazachstania africana CBS 2517]